MRTSGARQFVSLPVIRSSSIAIGSATYSRAEGLPAATITVRRTGGSASAVAVDYATSDGTATAPDDYASGAGTLSFKAGQKSATFTVALEDDALAEGDETLDVTLANPTGGATLGSPDTATLTITDDDAGGLLQFSATSYAAAEAGGTATIAVTLPGVARETD